MKIIETDNVIFETQNDWVCFFTGKWNWINFSFIEISVERDYMCGGLEVIFKVLGLGLRLYITMGEPSNRLKKALRSVLKNRGNNSLKITKRKKTD